MASNKSFVDFICYKILEFRKNYKDILEEVNNFQKFIDDKNNSDEDISSHIYGKRDNCKSNIYNISNIYNPCITSKQEKELDDLTKKFEKVIKIIDTKYGDIVKKEGDRLKEQAKRINAYFKG